MADCIYCRMGQSGVHEADCPMLSQPPLTLRSQTPEPPEARAALVERLAHALNEAFRLWVAQDPGENVNDGWADHHARAVLPIIDDLIAEKQAEVLREVERPPSKNVIDRLGRGLDRLGGVLGTTEEEVGP